MAFLTRLLTVALAGVLVAASSAVNLAGTILPGTPLRDDVKAAFLYNFTLYVEWPPFAFTEETDPYRLCVVGDDSVSKSVARIVEGATIDGRPLTRLEPTTQEDARSCHVLFIGQETVRAESLLAAVRGAPVLTVSDDPAFLGRGGVIALVVEGYRMRFDVNVPSARSQGLSVSSKLLRLARRVVNPRSDGP